jgi:hypothetical protein
MSNAPPKLIFDAQPAPPPHLQLALVSSARNNRIHSEPQPPHNSQAYPPSSPLPDPSQVLQALSSSVRDPVLNMGVDDDDVDDEVPLTETTTTRAGGLPYVNKTEQAHNY